MEEDGTGAGGRSLDQAPLTGLGDTVPRQRERTGWLEVGKAFEAGSGCRYEVLAELGQGGMAEVYRARRTNPRGFVLEVALKGIRGDLGLDPGWARLFQSEVALSKLLNHPGIALAHDLEEIGGRPYLVLEFVDGVSARKVIQAAADRGRPTTPEFACHLGACVAEALHHAHTAPGSDGTPLGIVHRDVSATNVMVTREGIPKLLDFGVAYARLEERDRTRTGVVRGTYSYLSPEQAAAGRAAAGQVDGRSDLFGLGLLLVELATGERVFRGEDGYLVCKAIAECSRARVHEATRDLPAGLQRVCRRLLEKDPGDRFQTGEELAAALRALLAEGEQPYGARECAAELGSLGLIEAGGPEARTPATAKGRRGWRPGRWGAVVAGAVVAGIGVGALGVHLAAGVASPVPQPVAVPRDDAAAATASPEEPPPTARPVSTAAATAAGGAPSGQEGPQAASPPRATSPAPAALPSAATRDPPGWPGGVPVRKRKAAPVVTPAVAKVEAPASEASAAAKEEAADPPPDPEAAPEPRLATHGALLRFADRDMVANAAGTLPRGTLLRARLTVDLEASRGGPVEVALTEDVVSGGKVVVTRGSLVTCRAGSAENGRLSLACDAVKAGDRSLAFSAIALGDGDRTGLRLVEGKVPAGTNFAVYVTAPAVLE